MPLLHAVCALMPSFSSLLSARVLAVVSAAIFTPQAASCLGLLVPASKRGRAITFVFLGWAVASVLGAADRRADWWPVRLACRVRN